MPRDASNGYALPEGPFQADTDINPAPVNSNFADLAREIGASLTRAEVAALLAPLLRQDVNGNWDHRGKVAYNLARAFLGDHAVTLAHALELLEPKLNRSEVGAVQAPLLPRSEVGSLLAPLLTLNGSRAMQAALPMGGFRVANMGAGTEAADAVRADQAFVKVGGFNAPTSPGTLMFALPPGFARFRLEVDDLTPGGLGALYLRISTDGGASYRAAGSDYGWIGTRATAAGVMPSGANEGVIRMSPDTNMPVFGTLDFSRAGPVQARFGFAGMAGGVRYDFTGSANCSLPDSATHIAVGFISVPVQRAFCTLYGSRRP